MKFKTEKAYKISLVTTMLVLAAAYTFGLVSMGVQTSSNAVGDSVAGMIFAVILTPGTILVAFKQKWATIPLIVLYILAFFTIIGPIAAFILIYALRLERQQIK